MKKTILEVFRMLLCVAIVPALSFSLLSCDPENGGETIPPGVTPEVSVPDGYENYFIEDLSFDFLASEVKVAFQINVGWTMKVVTDDGSSASWCSVEPASGDAGLHKVTVRVAVNMSQEPRFAKIQLHSGKSKVAEIGVTQESLNYCIVNGVSFTMIPVKGGSFTMGATSEQGSDASSNEEPAHQVTLSDYYIGETEVTQELWQAVMGSNPSDFTGNLQHPVECVSWNDCQAFITKLNNLTGENFRLPTEAEWEYAARGGNASEGYKYSGSNSIGDVAWYSDNSSNTTHPVKTKQANELGIYDMSGNVWEWCADWYSSSYYSSSPQDNPSGPSSGSNRVLRGGSWGSYTRYCRVAFRNCDNPSSGGNGRGLRLAR